MHTSSEKKILICTNYRANKRNPSCGAKGSLELLDALKSKQLDISIEEAPCMGRCQQGPNINILPNGLWLDSLSTEEAAIDDLIHVIKQLK